MTCCHNDYMVYELWLMLSITQSAHWLGPYMYIIIIFMCVPPCLLLAHLVLWVERAIICPVQRAMLCPFQCQSPYPFLWYSSDYVQSSDCVNITHSSWSNVGQRLHLFFLIWDPATILIAVPLFSWYSY